MPSANPYVKIGDRLVGKDHPTLITMDLGINHNGDMEIMRNLITRAHELGVHMVKLQKRTVPVVYSETALANTRPVDSSILKSAMKRGVLSEEAMLRLSSSGFRNSTNGDLKWALEFTGPEYDEIDRYCRELGIMWYASPWDEDAVDFFDRYDLPCFKIASPSLTDDDLLRHIRSKGRPVVLSTGMADMPMIEHAVEVLGTENLVILHCTSVYKQRMTDQGDEGLYTINLRGIETLRDRFPEVPIGFSANQSGIQPTYAAVVLGACMIEQHFTLWRGLPGSDHGISLDPEHLGRLCRMVREAPIVLGDGIIRFYDEEREAAEKLRRK